MQTNATISKRANPTARTQEEILQTIQKNELPMSLTAIAEQTKKSLYQVKATVGILEKYGVLKTLVSSGNTTFVILNKKEVKNAD